eukprot:1310570-Pleurochrysis_carterae.AAC.2
MREARACVVAWLRVCVFACVRGCVGACERACALTLTSDWPPVAAAAGAPLARASTPPSALFAPLPIPTVRARMPAAASSACVTTPSKSRSTDELTRST